MAINSRAKGAAGEREFCKWVKRILNLNYMPTRNLEQVRSGGADVMDVPPFCFEVKRCEKEALRDWWIQVKRSTTETNPIPIVAFRPNKTKWRFLIASTYIGLEKGYVIVEEFEFQQWVKKYYKKYLEYYYASD